MRKKVSLNNKKKGIEMEIRNQVIKIILNILKTQEEKDIFLSNYDIVQLDINSIDFIKLVVIFEETFNIEFDDENLSVAKFDSLESLCFYIEQKILSKKD